MAAEAVRTEVFERELRLGPVAGLIAPGLRRFEVIARSAAGEPAGTLSVVETTNEAALHRRCGLIFPPEAKVARYAQLAVRKPFRGMNIPALLITEAHASFVAPEEFDFSWLLFPARQAATSVLCRWLGFRPEAPAVASEYGRCRALLRDEHRPGAREAMVESARNLRESEEPFVPLPQAIVPNEMRL